MTVIVFPKRWIRRQENYKCPFCAKRFKRVRSKWWTENPFNRGREKDVIDKLKLELGVELASQNCPSCSYKCHPIKSTFAEVKNART